MADEVMCQTQDCRERKRIGEDYCARCIGIIGFLTDLDSPTVENVRTIGPANEYE